MATQMWTSELGNRELFIRRWEREGPVFQRVLEALPPERLDYRPHPLSRAAGELAALLVAAQQSFISLAQSRKSFYSGMSWRQPPGYGALAGMVAAFARDRAIFTEQLERLVDTDWNHAAWLLEGNQEILLKDTVGGLLWIGLFDLIHHRGQLTAYIRPMGGRVPSIYGPSGDEPVDGPEKFA